MDDFFFNSDPWGDFYGLARSPSPANNLQRPPQPPVASTSRPQRRPVASPTPAPAPAPAPKPKVVSIPVRHVGEDGRGGRRAAARVLAPSDAAKRIQKVFRGFVVRRMVKKVSSIAAEIDAIEVMMASRAEVEKISSDPREKLRVGELLMRLLLRLDSVLGVRDYRRKVIRRAIRMQEMVDSIPSAEQQMVDAQPAEENIEERSEGQRSPGNDLIRDAKEKEAAEEEIETTVNTMQEEGHCHAMAREEDVGEKQPEFYLHAAGGKVDEAREEETVDDGFLVLSMDEKLNSSSKEPEFKILVERSTMESDYLVPIPTATDIVAEIPVDPIEGETEVVKKIMAENEKLLQLVNALREQSAQQCKLIEGLTRRVGNLEQALQEMKRSL